MNITTKFRGYRRTAQAAFFVIVFSISVGQAWAGVITNSAHDFSFRGYSGGQICNVCHTPHNSDVTISDAPLWNHTITTQTYIIYSSPTLDATDITQPSGSSKLCLSCHDGTVAVDSYGGSFGGADFVTGDEAVGANGLLDDHPISFTYDSTLAGNDGALHDPSIQMVTIGSGSFTETGTIADVILMGNKVECATCHDVHNNFTAGNNLLRVTQNGSQLCMTCHNR